MRSAGQRLFELADRRRAYWVTEVLTARRNLQDRYLLNAWGQREEERRLDRADRRLSAWDWISDRLARAPRAQGGQMPAPGAEPLTVTRVSPGSSVPPPSPRPGSRPRRHWGTPPPVKPPAPTERTWK